MAKTPVTPTKTYVVKKRVHHDGKPLKFNQELDLTDEQAAPLLEVGHIVPAVPAGEAATA